MPAIDLQDIKKFEPIFGVWYAEDFIGAGSFGRVYRIKREEFDDVYYSALKLITIPADPSELRQLWYDGLNEESISTYYSELVKDISSEIRLMSKLRGNTNVVSYEDHQIIAHADGIGYDILIRMELLTNLSDYMTTNKYSRADVIKLGMDICSALELCQAYSIVHRDIKPDNIFVSETGAFKLGDFGVARQLERTQTNLSKKGTPAYMAPEVYKGGLSDSTVDIYSLGIVMYQLLNNGRLPFYPPAPAPTMPKDKEQAAARRMSGEKLPPPANATGRLVEIILKACTFEAKDRYISPKLMRDELTAIMYDEEMSRAICPVGGVLAAEVSHNIQKPKGGTINIFTSFDAESAVSDNEETLEHIVVEREQIYVPPPSPTPPTAQPWKAKTISISAAFICLAVLLGILLSNVLAPPSPPEPTPTAAIVPTIAAKPAAVTLPPTSEPTPEPIPEPTPEPTETPWAIETPVIPLGGLTLKSDGHTVIVAKSGCTAAVRSDGTVVTVGSNEHNVSGWRDIVSIAVESHIAGLRSDGTVVALGKNDYGQLNVSGWRDIVAIDLGETHTVGLKADGTVIAIGDNRYGQCNVSDWRDIIAIAAENNHTIGLKRDGTVIAVGDNTHGQCEVFYWWDIVAIATAYSHTVGIKADGTVVAVGDNEYGQGNVYGWRDIVAVAVGYRKTVGLRSDGTVVAIGRNEFGQCNVSDWRNIIAVSASRAHTVGLKSDGTVVAVGNNDKGQCNVSSWRDIGVK